jgi:hypothetical protein
MKQAPEASDPSAVLLGLSERARQAQSRQELAFILVNDTHLLAPYRQAALMLDGRAMPVLSGVLQAEANAPYVLWLKALFSQVQARQAQALPIQARDLPEALALQWSQWWPEHALCLPLAGGGVLLLAREQAWTAGELAQLGYWTQAWHHAHRALGSRGWWPGRSKEGRSRFRWGWPVAALALAGAMASPVQMTVLAPGELVPANPVMVRAPLEGVLDTFHVQPNQTVRKGQPLFGFDEALIQSRLDVARQSLNTAQTDYRQTSQQALADPRARSQLGILAGKIEEKRAETQYLAEQLRRSRVTAPQDGVVLMDDPSQWIGRPVAVGERILRIAAEGDIEVEAWLPLADAIELKVGDEVQLYLQSSPLEPVQARLRYMAHEAVDRPEGHQAFRVRATLSRATAARVGLKGTARLYGQKVALAYWVLRRPMASVRAYLGV